MPSFAQFPFGYKHVEATLFAIIGHASGPVDVATPLPNSESIRWHMRLRHPHILQLEVSRGLRVQFATRQEWMGLLIGKGGTRIRNVERNTGCNIEVIDGDGGGGGRGSRSASRGSNSDRRNNGGNKRYSIGNGGLSGGGQVGEMMTSSSCKVVISGPDADSVQQAKELMYLVEARIAVETEQVRAGCLDEGGRIRLLSRRCLCIRKA